MSLSASGISWGPLADFRISLAPFSFAVELVPSGHGDGLQHGHGAILHGHSARAMDIADDVHDPCLRNHDGVSWVNGDVAAHRLGGVIRQRDADGRLRVVAMGDAYQLAGFRRGATGQRQYVKKSARSEYGIDSRFLHFAQHRNSLGDIFLGENRNLGIGEEAARHIPFRDCGLGLFGGHARHRDGPDQIQRNAPARRQPALPGRNQAPRERSP